MTHKAQDAIGDKMTERDSVLKHDDKHDVAVIIPTCGGIQLLNCISRVAINSGNDAHIVVSLNPMDPTLAKRTKEICENITEPVDIDITWVEADRPLGFGGAVNAGIDHLKEAGFPETVIVLNDDTMPSPGWVSGIKAAFSPQFYRKTNVGGGEDGHNLPMETHPTVGIVGPVSGNTIREQQIQVQGLTADHVDQFAKEFSDENEGNFISAEFISGFCIAFSRDLVEDLINSDGFVFDPVFNERIGGFEDNDVCLRARLMGYGLMIAGQTYVHHEGHQTIGGMGIANGMANYSIYLKKWKDYTQRDQKLAASYRVKLETANDLFVFKESLKRMASVSDSISVLVTGNPSDIVESQDFSELKQHIDVSDQEMLNTCSVCDDNQYAGAVRDWVKRTVSGSWHAGTGDVSAGVWAGFFNERDERNAALKLTHEFNPDWIISVDHDEIFEKRVDRAFIERLMKNPSPEVCAYDFAWMNHWNSPDYIRVDSPWGDDGRYDGGMRGVRMYRHIAAQNNVIVAGTAIGLHCGNIPAFDSFNVRTVNARFHHFGYMRGVDRVRKYKNYVAIDKDADRNLIGERKVGDLPYQHLVDEVNMLLTPTPRGCGIALTGLAYEGEDPHHFIRLLDYTYSLVDQINWVWTDPVIKEPSEEWVEVGKLFGVDWVVHTFDNDLSACRNAGLDRIRETRGDGVGWLLTFDLDEFFEHYMKEPMMIRRMAEHPKPVAWLFSFINHLGEIGGEQRANESETHRMFRIDPAFDIKWEGRVHEGISRSIQRLRDSGFPAHFAKASFQMLHMGLSQSDEDIHLKLERYGEMLYSECEENPNEAMPWISLGLHFMNDGRTDEAIKCFNLSIATGGDEKWMAHKELGSHYMRMAKGCYALAQSELDEGHRLYDFLNKINTSLVNIPTTYPYIGLSKTGKLFNSATTSLPDALPDNVKRMLEEQAEMVQSQIDDSADQAEDQEGQQESLNK